MLQPHSNRWADLFAQTLIIIDQANSKFTLLDRRSFGGGTALMLKIEHRESFDVDIFVDDLQILPYLYPQTQGYELKINAKATCRTVHTRSKSFSTTSARSISSLLRRSLKYPPPNRESTIMPSLPVVSPTIHQVSKAICRRASKASSSG